MMNWARPQFVADLAPYYAGLAQVAGVHIWDHTGKISMPAAARVQCVRASADYGLYARFAMAALVDSDPVLLVDDDIRLPAQTIAGLLERWRACPQIVHGLIGRRPAGDGEYRRVTVSGRCPIILTRAAMLSRALCAQTLAAGLRLLETAPGRPRGNGEDIVMSYTAMAASRQLNCSCYGTLPFENIEERDGPEAICVRFPEHYEHRTRVIRWCRENIFDERRLSRQ